MENLRLAAEPGAPPYAEPCRRAMMRGFSRAEVRRLELKIEYWAAAIVEQVAEQGACDFVADVAAQFPVAIFMDLIGLPTQELRAFRALSSGLLAPGDPVVLRRASETVIAVLRAHVEHRHAEAGQDLVSELLAAGASSGAMTDEEIVGVCLMLILGGMETVASLTSFTFRSLAGDPELQARLIAAPGLIPAFAEDALSGFPVADPYASPCESARSAAPEAAIATDAQVCIGALVARLQLQILTRAWLRAVPSFRIRPDASETAAPLDSLPLVWDAQIQDPQIEAH